MQSYVVNIKSTNMVVWATNVRFAAQKAFKEKFNRFPQEESFYYVRDERPDRKKRIAVFSAEGLLVRVTR